MHAFTSCTVSLLHIPFMLSHGVQGTFEKHEPERCLFMTLLLTENSITSPKQKDRVIFTKLLRAKQT